MLVALECLPCGPDLLLSFFAVKLGFLGTAGLPVLVSTEGFTGESGRLFLYFLVKLGFLGTAGLLVVVSTECFAGELP